MSGLSSATSMVLAMLPSRRGQSGLRLIVFLAQRIRQRPYRERSKRVEVYRVNIGGVPVPLVTGYRSKRYLATPLSASTLPPASEQQPSGTPTQEVPELQLSSGTLFANCIFAVARFSASSLGPVPSLHDRTVARREYSTARRIFLWQRESGGPNEPNRAILLDPR